MAQAMAFARKYFTIMAELFKKDIPVVAPEFRVPRKTGTPVPYVGNGLRQIATATFDTAASDSLGVSNKTIATHGTGVYIPANAVITNVIIDVVTTFTDGVSDAATIALGVTSSTGAFRAAIAISDATNVWDQGLGGTKIGNFSLDGNALTQVAMGAAQAATWIKNTTEKEIVVAVAGVALTAGKANIFVEYFISA